MISDIVKSTNKTIAAMISRKKEDGTMSAQHDEFERENNIFINPKLTIHNFVERHLNNPLLDKLKYDDKTKIMKQSYFEIKNIYGPNVLYIYNFEHVLKNGEFKLVNLEIKTIIM